MSREVRLSRRDETLVDLLIETGLSRNIAKTLVFLSKRDETTSVEIEKATGLRQPEVSIAMQELRRRKWVDKRDIKKEGKGRPVHSDRLSATSAMPRKRPWPITPGMASIAAATFAGDFMGPKRASRMWFSLSVR